MAKKLTGMEIFKLLPKTNCKECGVPTCMAFAMKLSQKNAELSACPYASDAAKELIGAASEPPIRLVKFGNRDDRTVAVGNEIVMFRHEKTFVHQTAFAIQIDSSQPDHKICELARSIESYTLERVGEKLRIESILINDTSGSTEEFLDATKTISKTFGGALIIKSAKAERLMAAADIMSSRCPLLHAVTADTIEVIGDFAIAKKLPVVVSAPSSDSAYGLADVLMAKDFRDIVIDISTPNAAAMLQNNTVMRKAALAGSIKQIGYPVINFVTGRSAPDMIADASSCLCKYASILVLDRFDPAVLLPLMMLRQNIYTDPQKPIQVEPGFYKVGEPTPASPLMITTNFSLTYFIVSGETESSGVPVNLAVVEAEGMSVLTAWAAGKFGGEKIAAFLKKSGAAEKFSTRTLIIPGYVASISGELEEQMPGWEVIVGPQEASDIAPFMKRFAV